MISQLKLQEQDVWEAWIEFDQSSQGHFGQLYICGDVVSNGKIHSWTRTIETDYGTQLVIELPARSGGHSRIREFFYSESISNPALYHSICIYAGNQLLARFNEIDIMI